MSNHAAGVNPIVLKWAREKSGYSLDEVARLIKKDVLLISGWESGSIIPTYNQLEKLAYSVYKRPIAVFFFPKPPVEPDPKQSFRTLPDFEIDKLSPDTRYAIRLGMKMQISLTELNDGANVSKRKIFRDITLIPKDSASDSAKFIREYLGIPLSEQVEWGNIEASFKKWREVIQDVGIFIFKRSFSQDDVSGFCLLDSEFPIIFINNSTSVSRQIFTIFHELAHILLNTNGVTKLNDSFIKSLRGDAKDIEVFCNQFAAEFLVPSDDFKAQLSLYTDLNLAVESLYKRYGVSREVILRKLLDKRLVTNDYYESKVAEWNEEFKKYRKEKKGGGNYYATSAVYLGEKYLNLAYGRYYQGRCSVEQLADHLNVKVKNLAGLERSFAGGIGSL